MQRATRGAPARVSAPRVTGARAGAEGQNEHIWQAWATLEVREGNIAQARKVRACRPPRHAAPLLARARCPADGPARRAQLFDAATVANGSHAPAWHGWGLLEKRQGNLTRARDLWMKARPRSGPRGVAACAQAAAAHPASPSRVSCPV